MVSLESTPVNTLNKVYLYLDRLLLTTQFSKELLPVDLPKASLNSLRLALS
jgi:hypothetical protein